MAKIKFGQDRKHAGLARLNESSTQRQKSAKRAADVVRGSRQGSIVAIDRRQPGDSVGARYQTLLQAVAIVSSGLPIAAVSRLQQTSGLTLDRIKDVARISEGSFARRKTTGRLSQDESERLMRIGRVFERATALYDGDQIAAQQWLETPIPSLDNQRPLDLARTEPGAREVEDLIGRIEHGIVS